MPVDRECLDKDFGNKVHIIEEIKELVDHLDGSNVEVNEHL